MTEQNRIHAPLKLSPLAKAFEQALMSVDFTEPDSETDEVERALSEAISEYWGIGLAPKAIVQRLIELL